ncbi:P-selectin-like [Diadema setosum]|uniref:P-selectin-like n=1 Tax=Diadema setosum TaxID=31175 RepID=UPI003B3A17C4
MIQEELQPVERSQQNLRRTRGGGSATRTNPYLECDEGYILNGSATLQCVRSSDYGRSTRQLVWNASTPSCQAVKTNESNCDHPGNISHGKWNLITTRLGSTVSLECDEGYILNGSATLQCVRSSDYGRSTRQLVWNASTPSCQAVKTNESNCDHPGNISHGKWNLITTRLGSTVSLECDEGYILNGSATLQCVRSSDYGRSTRQLVWNASTPSCQAVKTNESNCDHPGNISHGKWNLITTRLGSTVSLECDEGYILNGSATLQCNHTPGTKMRSSTDTSSLPLRDIDRQRCEDVINARKAVTMDISGTVKKKNGEHVTSAQSTNIDRDGKSTTDEDGHLIPVPADDTTGSRNVLSRIYEEIPVSSDQFSQEPHYVNELANRRTIGRRNP